jgi:hypothetical protein
MFSEDQVSDFYRIKHFLELSNIQMYASVSVHKVQTPVIRRVHIQLNLQSLDNITAVLFQDAELVLEDLAKLQSCHAIVDMAS